ASLLGETLVMRGRLAAADSALQDAVARQATGWRSAAVTLAELAERRGDHVDALRRASALTSAYERGASGWTSTDRVAAGRAYLLQTRGSASAVRSALAAFDAAYSADPSNLDARLRAGELFLDKYDAPDAKSSFEEVLRKAPGNARALLGLSRVASFSGEGPAPALLRRSLAANRSLVPAHLALARLHLSAEAYDSATTAVRAALAVDSSSIAAWSLFGAIAWLQGEQSLFAQARDAARRLNPRPAEFYAELAEAAVGHRRYADGISLAREALTLDSTSLRALGLLGTNELRWGQIEQGRAHLERAFAIDAFNLWHKNTLDLLDQLKTFKTTETSRFRIIAPPEESELLTTYLLPLLEEAYDSLSTRYRYRPEGPIRIELYRRHADFSVRTMGIAGLGALGVSFGNLLAMDAPSARKRGEFNWGSTAWHELAHTFTLGMSGHRVPRWLSEGLSVLEERRARAGWGAGPTAEFIAAYGSKRLRPVSQLNDGFVRPRFGGEVQLSYYQASLVCEMIEKEFGPKAIVDMLLAYKDGLTTPAVFARVLKVTPPQMDARFDNFVRARFASPLRAITASDSGTVVGGEFVAAMRRGAEYLQRKQADSARAALERAQALFPDYAGPSSPAQYLASLAADRGDFREALAQITRVTHSSETAWEANSLEVGLREKLGDTVGTRAPIERLLWISPYDVDLHGKLAELATRAGDHRTALRERRAIIALNPPDPIDARYELARALAASGDVVSARREVLAVLEQAPSFEKGQALLLELRAAQQKSTP
ncbi:MAG TPA: tetratricopeptide repeat protein, partial [Gemmatimonadaceae bacterium]|nr:tetratricopeptide repeat protein [Gemmatimonadaceae bacterium]